MTIRHTYFIKQKTYSIQNDEQLQEMADYIAQNKDYYKGSELERSLNKIIAQRELIEDAVILDESNTDSTLLK